jgi:thiamine biosynthesis lipoprotein
MSRSETHFPTRTEAAMNTLVTIQACSSGPGIEDAIGRAFGWFHEIESRCTRFDRTSELMRLTARAGERVNASAILFEAIRFAVTVAEESGGAFDPTVGARMSARGFDREHRTGAIIRASEIEGVSYRDIELDDESRTILLRRPLTLDLGAVAKGLAVDMAARELQPFRDFAIDAGGDLYLGGSNARGEPWAIGIRHPREEGMIATVQASDQAVCTSGDYERKAVAGEGEHHILDPRTGKSPSAAASATVIAQGAMLADALATAAFVIGPDDGISFLSRLGVEGLIVTSDLRTCQTGGLRFAA